MATINSITPNFLIDNKKTTDFLSQNFSFSKELGESSIGERDFLDIITIKNTSLTKDSLIDKEAKKEKKDSFFSSDESYSNIFTKFPKEKLSYFNNKFSDLFSNADRFPLGNTVLDNDTALFLQDNSELVDFFNNNPALLTSLIGGEIKSQRDIKEIVTNFAVDKLNNKTEERKEYLIANFDLSKIVALDLGGISDVIKSDSEIEEAFGAGKDHAKELIKNQILDKVEALFPESNDLTRDFFETHLLGAVFLLDNQDEVNKIKNDGQDGEDQFTEKIDIIESQFAEKLVDYAYNKFGSWPGLSKNFLSEYMEFTALSAGNNLSTEGTSIFQFVNENRDLVSPFDAINTERIYVSYQARIARDKFPVDFPLDSSFLEKNFNLSYVINLSPTLADSLIEDRSEIERFINDKSNANVKENLLYKTNNTMNAFLSGFIKREPLSGTNIDLTV